MAKSDENWSPEPCELTLFAGWSLENQLTFEKVTETQSNLQFLIAFFKAFLLMYNLLGLVGIRVLPIVFHDEVTVVSCLVTLVFRILVTLDVR